jgi:hypothetical protein
VVVSVIVLALMYAFLTFVLQGASFTTVVCVDGLLFAVYYALTAS